MVDEEVVAEVVDVLLVLVEDPKDPSVVLSVLEVESVDVPLVSASRTDVTTEVAVDTAAFATAVAVPVAVLDALLLVPVAAELVVVSVVGPLSDDSPSTVLNTFARRCEPALALPGAAPAITSAVRLPTRHSPAHTCLASVCFHQPPAYGSAYLTM